MGLAQLDIGIQIDPNSDYLTKWSDADQQQLKDKVWTDIQAKVPRGIWSYWENLSLTKDHLSEAEIQVEINKALADHAAESRRTFDLRLKGTTPECIKYVWRNGERICIHCYTLQASPKGLGDFTDWMVSHEGVGKNLVTVTLQAELSWPSPA